MFRCSGAYWQGNPRWICGGRWSTGTGFYQYFGIFLL